MFTLYFLNIIPPIPLAIRDAGPYHEILRENGSYTMMSEDYSILDKLIPGKTLHIQDGSRIYVYSSIFAPGKLNAIIIHEWNYYDPKLDQWITKDSLAFPISGGRDAGYRGFSFKTDLEPGRWRVNIETSRGQVLGRVKFKIEQVEKTPELIEITKIN